MCIAVYETVSHVYIVMELVTGGELFDRIVAKDHYSETEAASVFVQMIGAIEYIHRLLPTSLLHTFPPATSSVCAVQVFRTRSIRYPVESCLFLALHHHNLSSTRMPTSSRHKFFPLVHHVDGGSS
jgi:16S rRNA A1518/A1519 N6-dimethyltransferase RsmA/KsgA/DIM1 with predicted DNA glycosylase/AP lyase activity